MNNGNPGVPRPRWKRWRLAAGIVILAWALYVLAVLIVVFFYHDAYPDEPWPRAVEIFIYPAARIERLMPVRDSGPLLAWWIAHDAGLLAISLWLLWTSRKR
jgi:hypothetical protein